MWLTPMAMTAPINVSRIRWIAYAVFCPASTLKKITRKVAQELITPVLLNRLQNKMMRTIPIDAKSKSVYSGNGRTDLT